MSKNKINTNQDVLVKNNPYLDDIFVDDAYLALDILEKDGMFMDLKRTELFYTKFCHLIREQLKNDIHRIAYLEAKLEFLSQKMLEIKEFIENND